MERRRIAILGSTGSIGRQTLDVVRQHPDRFEVDLLTANNSWELLASQAREFNVNNVVICNEDRYHDLSEALSGSDTKVFCGIGSACDLAGSSQVDIVVAAMVGFSGLLPTISAIKAGKIIALANKETLVAAGSIVMGLSRKFNAPILPVDSEHSAIFQCLLGASGNAIEKIHLTASGGPFRDWPKERIAAARKEEALRHPRWNMGAKITIDSATMMNKGFEVIEARWLFDIDPGHIKVVVHPESIIHSMIEFSDGAVLAQMGHPDMREPIQFALSFPERLTLDNRKPDFAEIGSLTFQEPDTSRFPALALAYRAIGRGGNIPCAMNAANEAAVAAYLQDRISFYDISDIVERCMEEEDFIAEPDLDCILDTNARSFRRACSLIERKNG
ncbi:MAG: 1-deoxy-D-xylulose-5-phosphate reductoisomerase [Bacteroidales bacterium]|nr:1-deoxy-D-xylulose-5-phosphate reductoisomerase [Bacteroidales bacterium]